MAEVAAVIEVVLTRGEWLQAAHVGCERQWSYITTARPRTATDFEQRSAGFDWNVNGAAGERVVAKWLDVPWTGEQPFAPTDVGPLHVRTTVHEDGRLLVRPDEPDDGCFVLVTGVGPDWRIRGFARGSQCKRDVWAHRGGAWFYVPQHALRTDFDALRRWVRRQVGMVEESSGQQKSLSESA